MDQQSPDIFYLFVQRVFEKTSSRELISKLLDNGIDSWEQAHLINDETISSLGLEQFGSQLKEAIAEVAAMEHEVSGSEGIRPLTVAIMMKGVNKKKDYSKTKPRYGYTKEQANRDTLSTVSALTINKQSLTHLNECINLCYNVQVLHLYENQLTSLRYIENLQSLRILYAHDNKITDASSISKLMRLEKVYLDKNYLDECPTLPPHAETISLSNQQTGRPLFFSVEALVPASDSLAFIICESSRVNDINSFAVLAAVRNINLKHNDLRDFDSLEDAMANMQSLLCIDLRGNPIVQVSKYRDRMVLLSRSLTCLDLKDILQHERQFLINLGKQKLIRRNQSLENTKVVQSQQQQPSQQQQSQAVKFALQKTSVSGVEKKIHYDQQASLNSAKGFYEAKVTTNTKHIPKPSVKRG